jgi:hypothetical protein
MTDPYPCGRCDSGTYANGAIFNPHPQAIAAGAALPRCKKHDRICIGAIDFKAAFDDATLLQQQAILSGKVVDL